MSTSRVIYQYGVVVHYSAEDECFYATIPALGIVTDGDTEEEAYAMAEDAITLRVTTALAKGEELPVESPPSSYRQVAAAVT